MSVVQNLQPRWNEIGERYLGGESSYDLAKQLGVHPENIRQILIKLDISRKTRKELDETRAHSIELSHGLRSRIDGWLLGDGSLSYSGLSGLFCLSSKHEEYVHYAKQLFEREGVGCRVHTNEDKKYKVFGHRLFTISTLQFGKLYHRWYPDGKKTVPDDLSINSYVVRHWIMDDGTVDKSKGHLRLCTCSFSVRDCERLSRMLNDFIGVAEASHVIEKHKYPRIYVPKKFVQPLLRKAGDCEVDCFRYKWASNKEG
jgi:hypothetical protein